MWRCKDVNIWQYKSIKSIKVENLQNNTFNIIEKKQNYKKKEID